MGYNAHLMRAGMIPSRSAAAGTAVLFAAIPNLDQRVTIPYLRLRNGATAANLSVLQTEGVFRFSLASAGSVIAVPGIPGSLSGRSVIIRYPSGDTLVTTVTAQTGENLTLANGVAATTRAILYLIGSPTHALTIQIPMTVSATTILDLPCPGMTCGKELGWPIMLRLENTDGNQKIEGGTLAYIGV